MISLNGDDERIIGHNVPGELPYRLVVPGLVLGGVARITLQHEQWRTAECDAGQGGGTVTVHDETGDDVALVLALIARRRHLAAVFGPAEPDRVEGLAPPDDDLVARAFNSVTQAAARAQRFLSLTDRKAIAQQVVADLRASGVIA